MCSLVRVTDVRSWGKKGSVLDGDLLLCSWQDDLSLEGHFVEVLSSMEEGFFLDQVKESLFVERLLQKANRSPL